MKNLIFSQYGSSYRTFVICSTLDKKIGANSYIVDSFSFCLMLVLK